MKPPMVDPWQVASDVLGVCFILLLMWLGLCAAGPVDACILDWAGRP